MHCWLNKSHNICISWTLLIAHRTLFSTSSLGLPEERQKSAFSLHRSSSATILLHRVKQINVSDVHLLPTLLSVAQTVERRGLELPVGTISLMHTFRWWAWHFCQTCAVAELTVVANNQINLFRCNDGAIARADALIFYGFIHFSWKYLFSITIDFLIKNKATYNICKGIWCSFISFFYICLPAYAAHRITDSLPSIHSHSHLMKPLCMSRGCGEIWKTRREPIDSQRRKNPDWNWTYDLNLKAWITEKATSGEGCNSRPNQACKISSARFRIHPPFAWKHDFEMF